MALQKLSTAGFSAGDRVMYELGLSSEFRAMMLLNSSKINSSFNKVKKYFQYLVSVQEEFLKSLLEVHTVMDPILNWSLENCQFENLFSLHCKYETDTKYSIQDLFEIHDS